MISCINKIPVSLSFFFFSVFFMISSDKFEIGSPLFPFFYFASFFYIKRSHPKLLKFIRVFFINCLQFSLILCKERKWILNIKTLQVETRILIKIIIISVVFYCLKHRLFLYKNNWGYLVPI
jgi:hypothetical protein